ncbi:MAG: DNA-processing protein DprA [Candidatus Caldarchaeum sp.]|nr:DNA-protecting protein DprA [Candidatus Caldarchaeum sp.]MDW8063243.1 DNA-processing protein DprA [Candidatus Caldarchaeum sp.]MDW8435590.1 DNA-processing protein DprA [Candidatus Caldarchaeum sp.]
MIDVSDAVFKYSVLSVEELLGRPLNRYEKKYAPQTLYVCGGISLPLKIPRVAVVGTRVPSLSAAEYTRELVKALVKNEVAVVSGLARGIDTIAHRSAIESGGKTVAVLGTPLTRFYPPENRELQLKIMQQHLAVSQFPPAHRTKPRDFVMRNRTMALISDASVIVEAGETSGALSQGWEALRLGRPLFISPLVLQKGLEWPEKMIRYGAQVLHEFGDLFDVVPSYRFELSTL